MFDIFISFIRARVRFYRKHECASAGIVGGDDGSCLCVAYSLEGRGRK
jgi:hypothetical protein